MNSQFSASSFAMIKVLYKRQKTLTCSGVIKDSLSKDHGLEGMDKKVHTGHPGKNAHDKSPL
jgi:hypothetical protein